MPSKALVHDEMIPANGGGYSLWLATPQPFLNWKKDQKLLRVRGRCGGNDKCNEDVKEVGRLRQQRRNDEDENDVDDDDKCFEIIMIHKRFHSIFIYELN